MSKFPNSIISSVADLICVVMNKYGLITFNEIKGLNVLNKVSEPREVNPEQSSGDTEHLQLQLLYTTEKLMRITITTEHLNSLLL